MKKNNENKDKLMSRVEAAHSNKGRRTPIGQGSKLDIPASCKDDGFHYHWFADRPGEIEEAEAAWYKFYKTESGDKIKTPGGAGLTLYLMRIKQEYYDEDMANQQKMVTETTFNNARIKKDEGQYSPEGEVTAVTRNIL